MTLSVMTCARRAPPHVRVPRPPLLAQRAGPRPPEPAATDDAERVREGRAEKAAMGGGAGVAEGELRGGGVVIVNDKAVRKAKPPPGIGRVPANH